MGVDDRISLEIDESFRRRFERAWLCGRPEPIEDCLPANDDPLHPGTLEELVCIELECGWRRWRTSPNEAELPPPLEKYLERFPTLQSPETTARLAEQEFLVRRANGAPLSADDYRERFPHAVHLLKLETGDETQFQGGPRTPFGGLQGVASEPPPRLGKYEILEKIGEGGMGRAYKARHVHLHSLVALKILSSKVGVSESILNRFQREGRAAAQLRHPNIAAALDADYDQGFSFLVFEYVEGENLARWVAERGPMPLPLALDLARQAAEGLEYAHSRGFVHRDVKPSNLIVDGEGRLKVVDLGLVSVAHADEHPEEWPGVTESHVLLGTADYMAPEQAFDARQVDHRVDIYSLGCTLFFLLTSHSPYPGRSFMERLAAHREQSIPAIRQHARDVPGDLERVFRRMLAKSPDERQQSMREVIDDLNRIAAQLGQADAPRPFGVKAVVAAVAILAILSLVAWGTTHWRAWYGAKPAAGAPAPGGQSHSPAQRNQNERGAGDLGRRILELGGRFEAELNGQKQNVLHASEMPPASYTITAVDWSEASGLTDAQLTALLPHLRDCHALNIENSSITSDGLEAIVHHLPNLRSLNASGLNFGDDQVRPLAALTNLQSLYLINVPVGDPTARLLSELPSLEYLWLGGTQISDEGLADLAQLPNLKSLGIGATRVTGDGLNRLQQTKLQELWLDRSLIGDEAIDPLSQLPSLKALGLEQSRFTEQGILELQRRLPECEITR